MYLKSTALKRIESTENGYTLVETLVAAVILVIVITAAISAFRKGVELETSDNHRREARTLLHTVLERDFDYHNYATVTMCDSMYHDTLDRSIGLLADGRIVVTMDSTMYSGQNIPLKKVTVTVSWQEPGSGNDSIQVEKWLASTD
jgi:prepilin-type N-terminal cleavage/methylation domain-containing protein